MPISLSMYLLIKICFKLQLSLIHSYIEHLSKCKWFPEEKIIYNHIIRFIMLLSIYQGIKLLHVSITEGEACHSEDMFLPPSCPAVTSCLLAMASLWTIMMSMISTFSQIFLPLFRTEYNFFPPRLKRNYYTAFSQVDLYHATVSRNINHSYFSCCNHAKN